MGVRGLASLLETHRQVYREVRFMKSRLVIDGCNLIYLLYFDSGLDVNHGGEYAAFEDLIERFITTLRDCGISPFVVLDGGSDYTDKKLETLMQRAEDRIRKAHQAAVSGKREHILPLLTKMVFRQTLNRLEVPLAQCYGEADQEIAALATEWQCPVLSNDSDFYIFELPAGLLPISHFKWEAVEQVGAQRYIPCLSYKSSSFSIFFDIKRQLLPAFAALAGNDYVKVQWVGSPISWAHFAPAGREKSSHLEGLLCWLKRFKEPNEALEAALGLMGEMTKKHKVELLQRLRLGMEEYQVPPSSLKRFFIHGTAPPFSAEEEVAGRVPDWMLLPLTQAQLTADVLDVLLLQRMNLSIPVDRGDMPSACLTSRPLRQLMYGLLLGRKKKCVVEEKDRVGLQLKFIPVKPVLKGITQQLVLNPLDKAEPSARLKVLLEALGVTEEALSCLPPQLRLPVAVTCYWLQKAEPPPDQAVLRVLLLSLSNGDTWKNKTALQTQNKYFQPKLDLVVGHALNQWQVCLKDSIHLNQLLGCPLPEPQIARLYEGTLVHQLVNKRRTECSSLEQHVVRQLQSQETPTSSKTQQLDDLTANLQQLFLQNDDTETVAEVKSAVRAQQDLHFCHMLSVRTRYKTKERNNRCSNPELVRKEEHRGWNLL